MLLLTQRGLQIFIITLSRGMTWPFLFVCLMLDAFDELIEVIFDDDKVQFSTCK
jgi:hypothetical protein